jgi:GNAT superfamily N-acetyltransferase
MKVIKKEWDSSFFNINIGYSALNEGDTMEPNSFDLVYVFSKVPLNTYVSNQVDVKITFQYNLSDFKGGPFILRDGFCITDYDPAVDDYETIKNLAISSGAFSRFKQDKRIGTGNFEALYATWIEKNLTCNEDDVIVVKKGSAIIAFVSVRYDIVSNVAIIDLVAVHENYRGQGIGPLLLTFLINRCKSTNFKKINVATQEQNRSAIALYKKIGFEMTDRIYVYHIWKNKDA